MNDVRETSRGENESQRMSGAIPSAPRGLGTKLLFEMVDDHIAAVTLNRPERRNAIDADIATVMEWVVEETERNPDIRVVLLRSSSENFFCAGAISK